MAYNYLRYAIVCPHLLDSYLTTKLKARCHLNNKGGVCACGR